MNPLRSVAAKLSLLTSALVLGVIGLMSQGAYNQIEQGLVGEMRVRAEHFGRAAREAVFPKTDAFALHLAVDQLVKEKAVTYASVSDAEGRVLSHSDPKHIGETPGDEASRAAATAGEILLQKRRDTGGAAFDLAVPLMVGTRRVGTARLGFDESSIAGALAAQKRRLLAIAAAATFGAVLGTVLIVGWITRPLPKLAAAAREIGQGKFDARVDWKSKDEIGLLARAFNDMASANAVLFAAIKHEKEKLETIFQETREGLVWTDPKGRILLMNSAAKSLLGAGEKSPGELRAAISGFEARPPLESVLDGSRRIVPFELHRAEPKLLILSGVADRLGADEDPSGYLMIFHNATLEKRGEVLARNFLSLVSHKLRTPLAVALGHLELLLGDAKNLTDMQRTSLRKIQSEDQKLSGLVEKVIAFSLVQSPENIVLERAPVKVADMIETALSSLDGIHDPSMDVRWNRAGADALPELSGDRFLLKSAVANLVENAVKFNRGAKKEAVVAARAENGSVRISVTDNGPGIPSEEHPKLFRKFYQIDDDFTGQIPGFGLGLAFVKSVVEAHGGTVGLVSEPGKGSEFFFTLPVKGK